MLKGRITALFLSKINVGLFSNLARSNLLLRLPYKLFAQRLIDFRFPQHLFLEATNTCNLKCQMCARNTKEQPPQSMEFNLFKKIIDEATLYGPRSFCLHIFGEPLLAPNIVKMMKYIKSKNSHHTILLTTNGTLLDDGLSNKILDVEVDRLLVSVIAAKEETYEKITRANLLKKVETNIINLISLKKSKAKDKPKVYVRMLKNEQTIDEVDLFKNKWSKFDCFIDNIDTHNYAGKIKNNIFKKKFSRYPCYHLWFSPGINCQGDVSICCCDWVKEAVLGNINKDSVSSIWQGDLIKNYRLYHLRGQYHKIALCKDCDVWTTYPDIFFNWQKR